MKNVAKNKNIRLITKLEVKSPNVIKGIQLEGLRVVGKPSHLAKKYYEEGIDEIIFIDAVASLYGRNNLFSVIEQATKNIFCPINLGVSFLDQIRTLETFNLDAREEDESIKKSAE